MVQSVKVFTFTLLLAICSNLHAEQVLRLATTTSTVNSGLFNLLQPLFEQESGYRIETSVVGSGQALQMGRRGEVDVIISHSPTAEIRFVEEGYGLARHAIMSNDFVLVGPEIDSAKISTSLSPHEALQRIATEQALFVSRGDGSGTHRKELSLWQALSIDLHWQDWYQELGASMADTLSYCSEQQGYTLTDRGTWLAKQHQLSLKLLYAGDAHLLNPYSAIVINPARHPGINHRAAQLFVNWLVSSPVQQMINDYRINKQVLFKAHDN